MDFVLTKNFRKGFILADALIGITIITMFTLLYLQVDHQMKIKINQEQTELISKRKIYEKAYR